MVSAAISGSLKFAPYTESTWKWGSRATSFDFDSHGIDAVRLLALLSTPPNKLPCPLRSFSGPSSCGYPSPGSRKGCGSAGSCRRISLPRSTRSHCRHAVTKRHWLNKRNAEALDTVEQHPNRYQQADDARNDTHQTRIDTFRANASRWSALDGQPGSQTDHPHAVIALSRGTHRVNPSGRCRRNACCRR